MFEHKGVHQCMCTRTPRISLGRRSMIDFCCRFVSSDLRPYVLDTRVKRGAELSTDHHLVVVSWIRWQRRKLDRPGRPKRIVRVCWERLAEPSVREVFKLPPTSGRASHRFRGRLGTLSPNGPCSLPPPLSTLGSSKLWTQGLWCLCLYGGNSPNPVQWWTPEVRDAVRLEEGVLSDHGGVRFGEAMEEDHRSALEEILANRPAPQKGEAVLCQHCLQCRWGAVVDLDWGHCRTVEEILRGSPQSHRLTAFQ
ncbi:hypothetical protein L3Q82_007394 [Scortum barcoo]|uniref:Uncharacterized protein n=1 Tax=Scortum barcoo TaxID=214431 RepID=A0ACB8WTF7_9TELE|nr:hypothetical protein L3Q82_007394 [Scortum barcoo]